MAPAPQRRSALPYSVIAGVVPCPAGWLAVGGRLIGTTLALELPLVHETFVDLVDYKPAFSVIAIHAPLGLLEKSEPGGRPCDRAARKLLGFPRRNAIAPVPSRSALLGESDEPIDVITRYLIPRYREVIAEMAPFRQRQVYEIHPEISFCQLNGDRPLRYPKRTPEGRLERLALLEPRVYGIRELLEQDLPGAKPKHILDAAAALWTARRIFARAVTRLPQDAEYDDQGLVMQILR